VLLTKCPPPRRRIVVAFAFSVICVFVLVALVEGVRRFGREYDRRLVRRQRQRQQARGEIDSAPDSLNKAGALYVIRASSLSVLGS